MRRFGLNLGGVWSDTVDMDRTDIFIELPHPEKRHVNPAEHYGPVAAVLAGLAWLLIAIANIIDLIFSGPTYHDSARGEALGFFVFLSLTAALAALMIAITCLVGRPRRRRPAVVAICLSVCLLITLPIWAGRLMGS